MPFRPLLLICSLICCWPLWAQSLPEEHNADTVLVCAPELLSATSDWVQYRAAQGHKIAVLDGSKSRKVLCEQIRQLHASSPLKFVVIMGDAPRERAPDRTQVETQFVDANVIAKWGAEPKFATDSAYADLDGDGSPDLAIGRICADSKQELAQILAKTVAYEQYPNYGFWRRRVNFVAGVGGFGLLADKIIESTAKKFITNGIPSGYQTSMTQASWRSPYSPDPRLFQRQTIETLNQGCLAWVYLGHGQERGLDYYRYPGGGLPIFEAKNVPQVQVREGAPIAVFLSCYTGAFAAAEDCLAEELLASKTGPVAVISGGSVTMPYAMTVLGDAMLGELFIQQRQTIGEVVLHAKQKLAEATGAKPAGMIDQVAKAISPNPELLDEERREHVRLFHLFGDPLLRIRHPEKIELDAPAEANAGAVVVIQGKTSVSGPCTVELVCRRDRLTFRPKPRGAFQPTDPWLRQLQATYLRANNTTWAEVQTEATHGTFTVEIKVPEQAIGLSHVRCFVEGPQQFAIGSQDIYLREVPKVSSRRTTE